MANLQNRKPVKKNQIWMVNGKVSAEMGMKAWPSGRMCRVTGGLQDDGENTVEVWQTG